MATTDGSRHGRTRLDTTPNGTARHTGLRIALGILSIVVGILVGARPVDSLFFVAVLFGIQLVVLGIVRIVLAASISDLPRRAKDPQRCSRHPRPASPRSHLLHPTAGVSRHPRHPAAAGWIADGVADLARGFTGQRSGGQRTYLIVLGVVSIVAGLVVAIFPGPSLALLTQIAGVALIVIGALTCLSAIMGRRRTT